MRESIAFARRWRLPSAMLACLLLWFAVFLPGYGQAAEEFLDPALAFRFSARVVKDPKDVTVIQVRYQIAPGYYLYRDQFTFSVEPPTTIAKPQLPQAKLKYDENFKKEVAYYRDTVEVLLPLMGEGPVALTAISQGCADAGLCYPPQETKINLQRNPNDRFDDSPASITTTLREGNLAVIVLLFYGLGLLLSFTPCMLPMVPILSSAIVGHGSSVSRSRGFALALTYTLGMAVVYTGLGIAAGLAGEGLAAYLQSPVALGVGAVFLVLVALSMFNVYQFQMPVGMQSWLARGARGLRGGRFVGVFAMGALSAAIVGPCVAAPLAGALVYISQTRDTLLGGLALFVLAIGMGTPLLLIGLSAGAILPRVGVWMEAVKRFFGLLLIAVAIYLVSPLLALGMELFAWAVLLAAWAALLGVFRPLPTGYPTSRLWAKGFGVALIVSSALLGAAALGGGAFYQPIAQFWSHRNSSAQAGPEFRRFSTMAELDQILARSVKPVMLDFYADWCVSCKEMERYTYTDTRVVAQLGQFELVQVDVTSNTPEDRALLKRFGLFGPPCILFFESGGKLVDQATVIGFQDASRFLTSLEGVPLSVRQGILELR